MNESDKREDIDLEIYGYFHFFNDLPEFLKVEDLLVDYEDIAIGKYIVLNDQITTKDGRIFGKKQEESYALTSMYSDQEEFEQILADGVLKRENCIGLNDVSEDEFDEFDNIKKATTLDSYREFMDYIKKKELERLIDE